MRIAICDDQKYVRDALKDTIAAMMPEREAYFHYLVEYM